MKREADAQPQLELGMELTGKLYRGEQEGSVQGWLFDHKTSLRIEFRGHRDPRPRDGGYLIVGRVAR